MPIILSDPGASVAGGETLVIDPDDENSGAELVLTDHTLGYYLLSHEYPVPDEDRQWSSSADTEGARKASGRPLNRTITVRLRCAEPPGGVPTIQTIVGDLQSKVGKLNREGGTYRRIFPTGDFLTFDVEGANIQVPADKRWVVRRLCDVTLTFECLPYGRAPEVLLATDFESTNPVAVFVVDGAPGDVHALGRMVVSNEDPSGKTTLVWGLQSRHYDAAAAQALFFQCESRALLGGAATAIGPTGASGPGSDVVRASNVGLTYTSFLDLAKASGGTVSAHVGTFRALLRVQAPTTNTGAVSVRLSWGLDASTTNIQNGGVTILSADEGEWLLLDLGLVTLDSEGPIYPGWLGAVQVKSTVATDDLDLDCFALIPADEGSADIVHSVGVGCSVSVQHDAVYAEYLPGKWARTSPTGDHLLIPPAGAEGREVRFIVKTGDGREVAQGPGDTLSLTGYDGIVNALSVSLYATPRYLVVPA